MAEKMGNTFDKNLLKSPLIHEPKSKKEPGPKVHNNPVLEPADPLGFAPKRSKK